MKITVVLILVLFAGRLSAQDLSGYVLDEETRTPVPAVTITAGAQIVSTAESGYFSLKNLKRGDMIQVSHISYKTHFFVKGDESTATVILRRNTTLMNSVVITSRGSYKMDSIRTRNDYESVFNYKAPALKDIFISRSGYNKPRNTGNSFNSIVSVNLLQVAALASKNKSPVSRLQKTLLQDEEDNYVNTRFSKEKVLSVTSLTGDSLQNFISRYRPSAAAIRLMSEYELVQYIKKKHSEFLSIPRQKKVDNPFK